MQPIVSVQGLTKTFGSLRAVADLSFTVEEGDVYGFLGQNGAGKSTTIRMLLSLVKPTTGSIEILGKNLHQSRNEILAQIGAVIEKPDVYKYLSAYDNLKLFAKLSGCRITDRLLMDQLELVGLAARAKDKVKTFSQGMKQRLGIAIALVHDPKLIILDEPTNGLDPQGIADVRNLILHLSRERRKTLIVSSHLLSEIEQVATKVLIIDKGQKRAEGMAAALFDYSQTLVELVTRDNIKARTLLQQSAWANGLQAGSRNNILLRINREQLPALHRWLVEAGIELESMQPRHSLEDYFLQVTSGNQHVEAYTD